MAGRDGFTGYGFDAPNDSHIAVHDAYLSNWDASNSVAISVLGGSGDHDDYDYRMDSVEQQVSTSKEDRPAADQDVKPTLSVDRSRSGTSRPTSSAGSERTPRRTLCQCGICSTCKNRKASAKCRANGHNNKVRIPQLEAENRVLKRQLQDAEKRNSQLAEVKAKNAFLEEQIRVMQEQCEQVTRVSGENQFMREMLRNCVCEVKSLVPQRSVAAFDVKGSPYGGDQWEHKPQLSQLGTREQPASMHTGGQFPSSSTHLPHQRQTAPPPPPPYYTQVHRLPPLTTLGLPMLNRFSLYRVAHCGRMLFWKTADVAVQRWCTKEPRSPTQLNITASP
ncbi:hypothetical protein AAVH_09814 [Aphelenchoides avenae]|nr:hypothetical protein AAVH_09814 [Aphelenchus avenae]